MKNKEEELLSFCSKLEFGTLNLSREEDAFRCDLDREMISLCKSLPKSAHTKAFIFLINFLQAPLNSEFNFVKYFYTPSWSILYWLIRSCEKNTTIDKECVKDAKTSHTMAMFLHALDDHLADGQLPVTHLALLVRSQSWMLMDHANKRLANGVDNGNNIVCELINEYYSSIGISDEMHTLDEYCANFRKQMATWLIVPILLAKLLGANDEYSHSIQSVYYSFGISWRLLDDLQDIEKDMMKGVHSSIYVCLDEKIKDLWDKNSGIESQPDLECIQMILYNIRENNIVETIKERACAEIESAAFIADSFEIKGFADELRCLIEPLRNAYYN